MSAGERVHLDLRALAHDRARHTDLVPHSLLAWWLLGNAGAAPSVSITLPAAATAPLRALARTGLLTAAEQRNVTLRYANGTTFEWGDLTNDPAQPRLPGFDWAEYDDVSRNDRLRIIPDLADPRRAIEPDPNRPRAFPWLGKLGIASPSIGPEGYRRLISDVDAVLVELIQNVHRWSRAADAVAAVSVTKGGGTGPSDEPVSWNRVHIVVLDSGIGIPTALRRDVNAVRAVHESAAAIEEFDDSELVSKLLLHAFGERKIPNHNGHGLNVAQIRAGQWVGALDVVTTNTDGRSVRHSCRGLSQPIKSEDLKVVGGRGTLIHLMLQATDRRDRRKSAAAAEELPFDDREFDEILRTSEPAVQPA